MAEKTSYSQLNNDDRDASSFDSEEPFLAAGPQKQNRRRWIWIVHAAMIIMNIAMGIMLAVKFNPSANDPAAKEGRWSLFQPLDDSMVKYETKIFDQGYGETNPKNKSERIYYSGKTGEDIDENWLRLYYPISRIKLSKDEAGKAGLDTVTYANGVDYVSSIDVAHQIHCLDEIRKATRRDVYTPKEPPKRYEDHIAHCINYLRQIIMCHGDTTLLEYHSEPYEKPGSYRQRTDFKSPHKCRNYQAIYDWAWERRVKLPEERDWIHYPYD